MKSFTEYAHEQAVADNFIPSSKKESYGYFYNNWRNHIEGYVIETLEAFACNNVPAMIRKVSKKYYRKYHPSLLQKIKKALLS